MLYHIEEYKKFVEITGCGSVEFGLAERFLKANRKTSQTVALQFFDAELIASKEHLYFAALNALQAFKNKTNLSKSLAMETMLYASAQRQIQKAIARCGIKPQTTNMAIVIIGAATEQVEAALLEVTQCVGVAVDEKVLEMTKIKEKKITDAFGITAEELKTVLKDNAHGEAVVNLVVERVALLVTQL